MFQLSFTNASRFKLSLVCLPLLALGLSNVSYAQTKTPTATNTTNYLEYAVSDADIKQSNAQMTAQVRPNIVGLWAMPIIAPETGKQCVEYYNFLSDGQLLVKSADEWSIGRYAIELPSLDSEAKLANMVLEVRYDNNEADCSGKREDQTGERQMFFAKLDVEKNHLDFCADDMGQECFAGLSKVLP
ncbi:hypothetical protein [Acinetobacter sp. c3-l95]|uniref:hypothetical protein n=1 Tax=Acinetobacter sp. c3-l95 TaxID=3342804 RepID=UPI0035BA2610